jgi:hypothetical protein
MPRPPTPIAVLQARGSVKKNPQRYREKIAAQPTPRGPLGPPPVHWDTAPTCYHHERHKRWCAIWAEIDAQVPLGTLKADHRILFEMLCPAVDWMRQHPTEIKPAHRADMLAMLGKLGMTPVDRMKVSSDERKRSGRQAGEWEKLA